MRGEPVEGVALRLHAQRHSAQLAPDGGALMRDTTCTGVHWPASAVVGLVATLVACKGDEPPPVPHPQITGDNVHMISVTK